MRQVPAGLRIALLAVVAVIAIVLVVLVVVSGDDSSEVEAEGPLATTAAPASRSATSVPAQPTSTTTTTTAASPSASTAAPVTSAAAATRDSAYTPDATDPGHPPASPSSPAPPVPPAPAPARPPFSSAIDGVSAEQLGASWHEGCPVGPDQLRLVTVSHWGFDGGPTSGQLVVHADHAGAIVGVMRSLYNQGFPIERMVPVSVYGGSDDASMAANNTSAFNCRAMTGGSSWSEHSYGWAIDLNPIQNPYIRGGTVLPPAGSAYTDRGNVRPGMIVAGDGTVAAFESIGWSWGGYWSSPRDYQHLSATNQ